MGDSRDHPLQHRPIGICPFPNVPFAMLIADAHRRHLLQGDFHAYPSLSMMTEADVISNIGTIAKFCSLLFPSFF